MGRVTYKPERFNRHGWTCTTERGNGCGHWFETYDGALAHATRVILAPCEMYALADFIDKAKGGGP